MTNSNQYYGWWHGSLRTGSIQIPLEFEVAAGETGLSCKMHSPSQDDRTVSLATVRLVDDELVAEGDSTHLSLRLGAEPDTLEARLVQHGVSTEMQLARGRSAGPDRPQQPARPFPYREIEVVVPCGDHTLSGTLTLPAGKAPYPAVVLVHGSGHHDRDETIFFHKPFLLWADFLTRRGVAVLRYDKRGTARSTGDLNATTADYADDAASAVDFLRNHREIRSDRIGIMGHSEGGIIAPLVARQDPEIAFIVLLAGTGVSGRKIMLSQEHAISVASGMSKRLAARNRRISRLLLCAAESAASADDATAQLREDLTEEQVTRLAPAVKRLFSPWTRYFLAHDPAPVLTSVKCPVLALIGSKDLQVLASLNMPPITRSLARGGNPDVTTMVLPGMNHLFQECLTGSPSEYANIEETVHPTVLEDVASWICRRAF